MVAMTDTIDNELDHADLTHGKSIKAIHVDGWLSFWRHADRAVDADGFSIQHVVLDDVLHERRELRRLAKSLRERNLLTK